MVKEVLGNQLNRNVSTYVNDIVCSKKKEDHNKDLRETSPTFRQFCLQLGTKLCFALVYHPQSNGVVEANGIIFTCIKKNIIEQPKRSWADELPKVIWFHNTSESRATKFMPFKLLYGEEAMPQGEVKLGF